MYRRKTQITVHEVESSENGKAASSNGTKKCRLLVQLIVFAFLFIATLTYTQAALKGIVHVTPPEQQESSLLNILGNSMVSKAFKTDQDQVTVERNSIPSQTFEETTPSAQAKAIEYHVVFSTACSPQQDWQSYVLFYHAFKVNQLGNVTRIVSGCNAKQVEALTAFHDKVVSKLSDRFHLHFTPDYSTVRLESGIHPYKYMNKPFGLRHWFENKLGFSELRPAPANLEDDVIILLDPDMILIKPITHDFSKSGVIWVDNPKVEDMVVRHGNPISQEDAYLSNEWLHFNFTYITGDAKSPAYNVRKGNANKHYNTGPPYLATVKDMWKIVTKWTEMAPLVFDIYPNLFAEMYGYCSATAHLKLPHTMIKSIVVSATKSEDREGWELVDALPLNQICQPPATANLPFILHYCQRYRIDKWFWSKYRIRSNFLSCEVNLLTMPQSNITSIFYQFTPPVGPGKPIGPRKNITAEQAKRESFMLCQIIPKVNEAVEHYKQKHCDPTTANFSRTYNIYDYPSYD